MTRKLRELPKGVSDAGAQMTNCFLSAGEIPDNIWFSEEWYNAIQTLNTSNKERNDDENSI
jgi:hypothetical protein